MKTIRNVACLLLILMLAGCKSQLYTGLKEREGNDMLALLLESGIPATKEINKDLELTLFVPSDEVARSINLLRSSGYPRDRFSSVGDIFPKDGLISSPTEERARYTYSMSQELSSTLSMIDGVITARVHVVLPQESNGAMENPYPSSAAVFIKYSSDLVLTGFTPKVKTLVSNSIEGLSLDKITVTLFPTSKMPGVSTNGSSSQSLDTFLTVEVTPETKGRLMLLVIGLSILVLLLLASAALFIWLMVKRKQKASAGDITTLDVEQELSENSVEEAKV